MRAYYLLLFLAISCFYALISSANNISPIDKKDSLVLEDRNLLFLNNNIYYSTLFINKDKYMVFILYKCYNYDKKKSINSNWRKVCEYKWRNNKNVDVMLIDANVEKRSNVIYYNIIEDVLYSEVEKGVIYSYKNDKCEKAEDINE